MDSDSSNHLGDTQMNSSDGENGQLFGWPGPLSYQQDSTIGTQLGNTNVLPIGANIVTNHGSVYDPTSRLFQQIPGPGIAYYPDTPQSLFGIPAIVPSQPVISTQSTSVSGKNDMLYRGDLFSPGLTPQHPIDYSSVPSTFMSLGHSQTDFGYTTASASGYTNDPSSDYDTNCHNESAGIGSSSTIDTTVVAVPPVDRVANSVQYETTQSHSTGQQACDPTDLTGQHDGIPVSFTEYKFMPVITSTEKPRLNTRFSVSWEIPRVKSKKTIRLRRHANITPTPNIQPLSLQTTIVSQVDNGEGHEALFYSVSLRLIEEALSAIQIGTDNGLYKDGAEELPLTKLSLVELFRLAYSQHNDRLCKIIDELDIHNFKRSYLQIFVISLPETMDRESKRKALHSKVNECGINSVDFSSLYLYELSFPKRPKFYLHASKKGQTYHNLGKTYEWYVLAQLFVKAYGTHDGNNYLLKQEFATASQSKIEQENFDNAVSWIETFSGLGRFSDMFCHELALALKKNSIDWQCYMILSIVLFYLYETVHLKSSKDIIQFQVVSGIPSFSRSLSTYINEEEQQEC